MEDPPLDARLFRGLVVLAALAIAGPASAQTYPGKTIRMIVTFAPGGPTDVIGRIIAQKASEVSGSRSWSRTSPGAGGNIGVAAGRARRPTATRSWS